MTLEEAIKTFRHRPMLPEEQVLAEQIEEYADVDRCPHCGSDRFVETAMDFEFSCVGCMTAFRASTIARRNFLAESLVTMLAHDAGQPAPGNTEALKWCEDHDRALLDCLLSVSREVVELRVRIHNAAVSAAEMKAEIDRQMVRLRPGGAA